MKMFGDSNGQIKLRAEQKFVGYTFFSSLKISNKNILKNILEI